MTANTAITYENITPILSNILIEKKLATPGHLPKARKTQTASQEHPIKVSFSNFQSTGTAAELSSLRRVIGAALRKLGITQFFIDLTSGSLGGMSVTVLNIKLALPTQDAAAESRPASAVVVEDAASAPAGTPVSAPAAEPETFDVTLTGTVSKTFKATAGATLKSLLKDEPGFNISSTSFQDSDGRAVSADRKLTGAISVTASRRTSGG